MTSALIPDQITRVSAPDLTRDLDLLDDEVLRLVDFARDIKQTPGRYRQALSGKWEAQRSPAKVRSASVNH
jgi:hypothetical protein